MCRLHPKNFFTNQKAVTAEAITAYIYWEMKKLFNEYHTLCIGKIT